MYCSQLLFCITYVPVSKSLAYNRFARTRTARNVKHVCTPDRERDDGFLCFLVFLWKLGDLPVALRLQASHFVGIRVLVSSACLFVLLSSEEIAVRDRGSLYLHVCRKVLL